MCHIARLYLPNRTNSLRQKGDAQGLDKFFGELCAMMKILSSYRNQRSPITLGDYSAAPPGSIGTDPEEPR